MQRLSLGAVNNTFLIGKRCLVTLEEESNDEVFGSMA